MKPLLFAACTVNNDVNAYLNPGDNTARASDKQQFDKLISNLKDPSIQSTADVHRAPAKPFSLKEFLASNPAPTYDGMYPMYTCKPTLLRPDSFQSTTESVAAETQPKKVGPYQVLLLYGIAGSVKYCQRRLF